VTGPLAAAEAAGRILEAVERQPPLRMPLDDALDSVLAEDLVSPIDVPAWANSAMDGYAVRREDVTGASAERPVRLRVVEQIPAGAFPSRTLGAGESARIFTGAPLPPGADTVVRQEDTDQGAETVTIVDDPAVLAALDSDSTTAWALTEYFSYLDSIRYSLDFNDKSSSKVFFDTCDWLVSESGKRVFQ
jgi:molybdopterin biosynthesis enzyme